MRLVVVKSTGGLVARTGKEWNIGDGPALIGREPVSDIHLDDRRVSRKHARIFRDDEGWQLENLSRHGVFVNRERLDETRGIRAGDFLQCGGVLLRVVDDGVEKVPASTPMLGIALPGESETGRAKVKTNAMLVVDSYEKCATFQGQELDLDPTAFQLLETLRRLARRLDPARPHDGGALAR